MVRRRSYARYAAGGAVHSEPIELDSPKATIVAEKVDDASDAFAEQIAALKRAEHFAKTAQQPQVGLTPRQQAFLDANPEMLDEPDRLGRAILKAHQQGFTPDSHEFHAAVAANWRNHHLEVAASNRAKLDGHQEGTAEHQRATDSHLDHFIEQVNDKPATPKRAKGYSVDYDDDQTRGRIVSAPVSRSVPDGGSYNERGGRVVMTPEMKQAAKISGISETEYAAQVLRLRAEKAEGHHTGKP